MGKAAMKERGKACEEICYFSSSSSDLPCVKHPSSNSVGICAFCLKDRLVKLVCSDCGEQRLSSCSCSEISSNRNSCTFETGSVGRVSFLIENERIGDYSSFGSRLPKLVKSEEMAMLKRSSSSCVEIKRGRLWSIGRFFRKKKEKGNERINNGGDERSDWWMFDQMRMSRSRSLCSFRGNGGVFGSEDGGETVFSGGRSSVSGARTSSVNGGMVYDSGRRSGFSETEPRKSGLETEKGSTFDHDQYRSLANKRIFSLKETDFNGADESEFIDFKLDFGSELHPEFSATRGGEATSAAATVRDDRVSRGGSCRITVSDKGGITKARKSSKGAWRWIFRPPPNWVTSRKKEDLIINT